MASLTPILFSHSTKRGNKYSHRAVPALILPEHNLDRPDDGNSEAAPISFGASTSVPSTLVFPTLLIICTGLFENMPFVSHTGNENILLHEEISSKGHAKLLSERGADDSAKGVYSVCYSLHLAD